MKNVILILSRDYKHVNTENIQFDWQKVFRGKTVNKKCKFLTATLTNISPNFIPHKTKKFNYKTPEWMNSIIISSLKEKKKLPKIFYKDPSNYHKNSLFSQTNKCANLILQTKADNIAKMSAKLDEPHLVPKT